MHVRHMIPDDIEAAALLCARRVSAYTHWAKTEATPDLLMTDLLRAHSESFVALAEDAAILGYTYARIRRGALWLDRLVTSHDDENTAAVLLHAVIVNYIGESTISVAIDPNCDHFRSFFEHQGFVLVDGSGADGRLVLRRSIARA